MNKYTCEVILHETGDADLYRLALAGKEDAFLCLYRRWQAAIYRFALRFSGSASVAEDVTQEVFLAIVSGGSGYDPAFGPFSSYLYGIARNHILRRLNRERIFAPIAGAGGENFRSAGPGPQDPLSDLTRRENIDAVHRAIGALPPRYREVVILCELQELSYADAAGIVGCPEGTVRSRLHRARAMLLQKLRPARNKDDGAPGIQAARCMP